MKQYWQNRSYNIARLKARPIPLHIAVILDGNGRWALRRGLPRFAGHMAGAKRVREITMAAAELGVQVLTYFVFSTENWRRPHQEVRSILRLPLEMVITELPLLLKNNVKVNIIGNINNLPVETKEALTKFVEKTSGNTGMQLNLAVNYGARGELTQALSKIAEQVERGLLRVAEVTEELIKKYLWTAGMPDPDLVIRTGGDFRLSNFLLWQLAYSELWFTKCLWPDFSKQHFFNAVSDFQGRSRRYGGV
ncbi:MAG: hypothetical protein RLZ12_665 [Bacillota bacterium]